MHLQFCMISVTAELVHITINELYIFDYWLSTLIVTLHAKVCIFTIASVELCKPIQCKASYLVISYRIVTNINPCGDK